MTTEELKKERDILSGSIMHLIIEFQKKTGFSVSGLEFFVAKDCDGTIMLSDVRVEVKL